MLSTPTTPTESSRHSPHEASPVVASGPICPNSGSIDTVKHGPYTRSPHGHGLVRVQLYLCSICVGTFSPSLSYVEDGPQYPSEVKRLGRVVNAFTDASLENLQYICTSTSVFVLPINSCATGRRKIRGSSSKKISHSIRVHLRRAVSPHRQ